MSVSLSLCLLISACSPATTKRHPDLVKDIDYQELPQGSNAYDLYYWYLDALVKFENANMRFRKLREE